MIKGYLKKKEKRKKGIRLGKIEKKNNCFIYASPFIQEDQIVRQSD